MIFETITFSAAASDPIPVVRHLSPYEPFLATALITVGLPYTAVKSAVEPISKPLWNKMVNNCSPLFL